MVRIGNLHQLKDWRIIMNDVIWSINIMILILLIGVSITIYWIFTYDDRNETTVKEELLQLPSDESEQSG